MHMLYMKNSALLFKSKKKNELKSMALSYIFENVFYVYLKRKRLSFLSWISSHL